VALKLGYRFNEIMKKVYSTYKLNNEKIADFLRRYGVNSPKKVDFKNYMEMIIYIFKNSGKYKALFKDIEFPIKRITIDYYHKEKSENYKIDNIKYFYLLDYSYVRKLRLYLKSHRIIYLRRDIKGWYISPANF
jgi:hypothetical protein